MERLNEDYMWELKGNVCSLFQNGQWDLLQVVKKVATSKMREQKIEKSACSSFLTCYKRLFATSRRSYKSMSYELVALVAKIFISFNIKYSLW
jgi:hypothetical protein